MADNTTVMRQNRQSTHKGHDEKEALAEANVDLFVVVVVLLLIVLLLLLTY